MRYKHMKFPRRSHPSLIFADLIELSSRMAGALGHADALQTGAAAMAESCGGWHLGCWPLRRADAVIFLRVGLSRFNLRYSGRSHGIVSTF
jgi:hypothetical protein